MRSHFFASLILGVVLLPGAVFAQPTNGGFGIPPFPGSGAVDFTVGDVTAPLGSSFEVQIDIAADDVVYFVDTNLTCDATQVAITGFQPGAGLQAYIDDNGPLGCDAGVTPDNIWIFMLFTAPFDTDVYGTDFLRVQFNVVTPTPGDTEVTLYSSVGGDPVTATVTVTASEPQFTRGDANGDNSCNLTDAMKILSHIFLGDSIPCRDAADVDDSGNLNLQDPIKLLNGLFLGGAMDESCGIDVSTDALDCTLGSGCP